MTRNPDRRTKKNYFCGIFDYQSRQKTEHQVESKEFWILSVEIGPHMRWNYDMNIN